MFTNTQFIVNYIVRVRRPDEHAAVVQWIPEHEADVAVLEEPEHLNWYQHGTRFTDKFNHVVGIMHTNYLDYARREKGGNVKEVVLRAINSWVCRAHTHKVVKLSDAVQRLPRQCTQFVHGVSPKFLEVGAEKSDAYRAAASAAAAAAAGGGGAKPPCSEAVADEAQVWPRGAYFLGKVVWAKGYTELLDLLEHHKEAHGQEFPMHIYGHGGDKAVRTPFSSACPMRCAVGVQLHTHMTAHIRPRSRKPLLWGCRIAIAA